MRFIYPSGTLGHFFTHHTSIFYVYTIYSLIIYWCKYDSVRDMFDNTLNKKKFTWFPLPEVNEILPRKFFINTCKINTKVRDVARDTYYFLINFLILALLLVGELSTLTLSFNSPTIIPITLFTLFRSSSGFSLTADFERLIWYSLPLVEYIPSGVYMIKCYSVPVVTIP